MTVIDMVGQLFRSVPSLTKKRWMRKIVTRIAVSRSTKGIPPRPNPFVQTPDYTSWQGFVDRRITGRHLRAVQDAERLPPVDKVVDLFLRPAGEFVPCQRSSLLFAGFAQWFTDSFLRTAHGFEFDESGNPILDPNTKRPKRDPLRHTQNDSNHEIDLCQIYGLSEEKTRMLRRANPSAQEKGFLEYELFDGAMFPPTLLEAPVQAGQVLPIKPRFEGLHDERLLRLIFAGIDAKEMRSDQLFAVGLEHGNSTVSNSLFNVIFLREHNRVARIINQAYQRWDDERVFQVTRNILIVMALQIVVSDYIRHLSPGSLPLELVPGLGEKKSWYRTNRIAIEFNILYRWHELIPDSFNFLKDVKDFRHNNRLLTKKRGVEDLITALSGQKAGSITLGNSPRWLRNVLDDTLSIMRSSKLAPYNDYREHFGLSRAKRFEDITTAPDRLKKLKELYGSIDDVEWHIGMYAEDHEENAVLGELMMRMVAYDAFTHVFTNPLISTGVFSEETFSAVGIEILETQAATLQSLILRNVQGPVRVKL